MSNSPDHGGAVYAAPVESGRHRAQRWPRCPVRWRPSPYTRIRLADEHALGPNAIEIQWSTPEGGAEKRRGGAGEAPRGNAGGADRQGRERGRRRKARQGVGEAPKSKEGSGEGAEEQGGERGDSEEQGRVLGTRRKERPGPARGCCWTDTNGLTISRTVDNYESNSQ